MSARAAQVWTASVYWEGFGHPLADSRHHNASELLAAHRTLPLGSSVLVTNLATGRSIVIRILDRGPYAQGRCLDVTRPAAARLGITGLARVRIDPLP